MDSFSRFFSTNGPRHRSHGFTDTHRSYRRKKQNLMGDIYKKDLSKNQNIERLKKNPGTHVCCRKDLEDIRCVYRIVPHKYKEQKLGRTGITLSYNPQNRSFILTK